MAESKRSQIAELMAQVSMLTAEADELDPSGSKNEDLFRQGVRNVTLHVDEDEITETPEERKPKRTRKPRTGKPAKTRAKPDTNDKPTEKAAMTALKDAGEPISIGTWAETLGCEKSVLVPLVSTLMSAKAIKRTGEKRGTKYQVRK
jgi:hypothetical protein